MSYQYTLILFSTLTDLSLLERILKLLRNILQIFGLNVCEKASVGAVGLRRFSDRFAAPYLVNARPRAPAKHVPFTVGFFLAK